MFEYYLIAAVVAAGISGLVMHVRQASKAKRNVQLKTDTTARSSTLSSGRIPPPSPPATLGLTVPGATHVPLRVVTFLRHFGLSYAPLRDCCFIQGPLSIADLPPLVIKALVKMHSEGDAVGPDIMEFLFHARKVQGTEMLTFVLLEATASQEPRIVAFIDKMRFPIKPRAART